MKHLLRFTLSFLLGLTLTFSALALEKFPYAKNVSVRPENTVHYTTDFVGMQEQIAWNLLNQDRSRYGLAPLPLDSTLSAIARAKSRDMHEKKYFAHLSPTYGSAADMLRTFRYPFKGVGENIAHHATVHKSQAAFLSSSGHRINMMAKHWSKVGIGVWQDDHGFVYVTQLFVR